MPYSIYYGARNKFTYALSISITWSSFGKILLVYLLGGLTTIFAYDALQNYIQKRKVSSIGDISTDTSVMPSGNL
jgi:hypothetical protein